MKYYKIYEPISKKIYGTFPNFRCNTDNSFYLKGSILLMPLFAGNDNTAIVPELFQHRKTSKITDCLNSRTAGFGNLLIISSKLKELLSLNNIFEMTYFKTIFTSLEGIQSAYYFVKPKYEALDSIDCNKTEFYEWENIGPLNKSRNKPLFFKDKMALLTYEKSKKPNYEILKLAISENWDYDFFALKMVEEHPLCFIVSEKLKDQIEKEGLTGVGFLELNTLA